MTGSTKIPPQRRTGRPALASEHLSATSGDPLLTVLDITDYARVGRTQIYDAIARDDLETFKLCGRRVARRSAVDRWIDSARMDGAVMKSERDKAVRPRTRKH